MLDFDNFPIDALPPILRNAAMDAHQQTLAPIPLIVSSVLGASSLAFQESFDVQRPNGLVSPVSIYTLVVAESGERKSTVDSIFTQPIRDFERSMSSDFDKQLEAYQAQLVAWNLNGKNLQHKYKFRNADGTDPEILEHIKSRPQPPVLKRLLYNDTTPEAVKYALYKSSASMGVFSAEASTIFDGHGMTDLAFINDAWSGSSLRVDRRCSESFVVENPRITMSMMCQPTVFMNYLKRHGDQARGIGLFARFLLTFPTSTQGFRTQNNMRPSEQPGIDRFYARIKELLDLNTGTGGSKTVLTFAPNAALAWQNFYNFVESNSAPGCQYYAVRDYASKLAENVARIAAIFHIAQSDNDMISMTTIDAAISVAMFFMNEFCRLWGQIHIPQEIIDANSLIRWLERYSMNHPGHIFVEKKIITQCATPSLRKDKPRRSRAIAVLISQGLVREVTNGRKYWLELNPAYFPATTVVQQPAAIQAAYKF